MASQDGENNDTNSILIAPEPIKKSGSFSAGSSNIIKSKRKWDIERTNLLNIGKICIKTLIDESMTVGSGRVLTEEFSTLEQFFIVLEHILRHGLKDKRTFLGSRKDFLAVLEAVEPKIPSLSPILLNIKHLTEIRTNVGKMRAWMRLALMQKLLAEQLIALVEEKEILGDWYEENSIILSEEGSVIAGMLVGINVIDCNFDLKGIDLDAQNGIIDLSLYLRDGNYLEKTERTSSVGSADGQKIEVILDQKAYLEQLNKTLNESVASLKQQAKEKSERDEGIAAENEELRSKLACVIAEREEYKRDYQKLLDDNKKREENFTADLTVERETYEQSRTGLNELYLNAKNELEKERQEKKDLEILLEENKAMNQEKQIAMRLLEKDIHDKQDTLIALRKQLEDIKKINLELHNKWQNSEGSLKKHEGEWSAMEQKCSRMIAQTKELEKSLTAAEIAKKVAEETSHQIGARLVQAQAEKATLETDLQIEREWRLGLQAEVKTEKDKVEVLTHELKDVNRAYKETEELRKLLEKAELRCSEQESALYEMGQKLNKSHTEVDEMKEIHAALKKVMSSEIVIAILFHKNCIQRRAPTMEYLNKAVVTKDKTWQDDKDATECQQCNQQFSLSRRKHHCRSCGGIFCNSCSDNNMPLPSFAKPVRVCDGCYDKLLSRYNAATK